MPPVFRLLLPGDAGEEPRADGQHAHAGELCQRWRAPRQQRYDGAGLRCAASRAQKACPSSDKPRVWGPDTQALCPFIFRQVNGSRGVVTTFISLAEYTGQVGMCCRRYRMYAHKLRSCVRYQHTCLARCLRCPAMCCSLPSHHPQLSKELEAAKRELRKDGAGAAFEALESATSPGPGADRGLLARAAAGRLIDQLQRKMEQARRWGDWTGGG